MLRWIRRREKNALGDRKVVGRILEVHGSLISAISVIVDRTILRAHGESRAVEALRTGNQRRRVQSEIADVELAGFLHHVEGQLEAIDAVAERTVSNGQLVVKLGEADRVERGVDADRSLHLCVLVLNLCEPRFLAVSKADLVEDNWPLIAGCVSQIDCFDTRLEGDDQLVSNSGNIVSIGKGTQLAVNGVGLSDADGIHHLE